MAEPPSIRLMGVTSSRTRSVRSMAVIVLRAGSMTSMIDESFPAWAGLSR